MRGQPVHANSEIAAAGLAPKSCQAPSYPNFRYPADPTANINSKNGTIAIRVLYTITIG